MKDHYQQYHGSTKVVLYGLAERLVRYCHRQGTKIRSHRKSEASVGIVKLVRDISRRVLFLHQVEQQGQVRTEAGERYHCTKLGQHRLTNGVTSH